MSRLLMPTTRTLIKSFATTAAPVTSASSHKFTLPKLPYAYSALEPAISGQIMEVHHTKHHQAYVTNLNAALASYADAEQANDLQKMISLQPALRFHGGGHVNHSIFWTNLAPPKEGGGGKPTGELLAAIEASYGSFDKFKESMSAQSIGVQGSGWGWLGYNKAMKRVEILTKPNQVRTHSSNTEHARAHAEANPARDALTADSASASNSKAPAKPSERDNCCTSFSACPFSLQHPPLTFLSRRPICAAVAQDPLTELVPLLGFDVWEHGQSEAADARSDGRQRGSTLTSNAALQRRRASPC